VQALHCVREVRLPQHNRREAACETMRSGTDSSTRSTRGAIEASLRSGSPTAQSNAMFDSTETSANSDSASEIDPR